MRTALQTIQAKPGRAALFLTVAYGLVGGIFLRNYLQLEAQWLLVVCLVPLVALPGSKGGLSPALLFTSLLFIAASAFLKITTLFYFSFLLSFWYCLKTIWGRTGLYALLLLLLASPVFFYFANIWSFPLRLQLTQWAVHLLQFLYPKAEVMGNVIMLNGERFSVDPACAGLNMLSFSLIIAVVVMALLHKAHQKPWPWWVVLSGLGLMVFLNVVSNLFRIMLLVIFKIPPENFMHDVVGLICLLLYALVPFFLLSKYAVRCLPQQKKPTEPTVPFFYAGQNIRALLLNGLLLTTIAWAGYQVQNKQVNYAPLHFSITGYQKEELHEGVQKYHNAEALVYLKPNRAFYSAEHHPFICWEGSGYLFKDVQQTQFQGQEMYMGKLVKEKDVLFTAWWMDNGQHQTITQTDWRWRMLKGEPSFYLVNVTAASEPVLQEKIAEILHRQ